MIIEFPAPAPLLSLNGRLHHMKRYRFEQLWQQSAFFFGIQAVNRIGFGHHDEPSTVKVTLPVKSLKTRRDPHNFIATVKPIVDGLVKTNRFWPDDTAEWVTVVEPEFWTSGMVLVEINPRRDNGPSDD